MDKKMYIPNYRAFDVNLILGENDTMAIAIVPNQENFLEGFHHDDEVGVTMGYLDSTGDTIADTTRKVSNEIKDRYGLNVQIKYCDTHQEVTNWIGSIVEELYS